MTGPEPGKKVVIGIGNEFRRDDGAGLAVLEKLRPAVPASVRLVPSDGEPAGLIETWAGADLVIVVDAVRPDPARQPAPGRTHRLAIEDADARPASTVSSHGLGLGDAVGLARAVDRMPARLIVHAVEVADCDYGTGLSSAVEAAVDALTAAVLTDLELAPATAPGAPPGSQVRSPARRR